MHSLFANRECLIANQPQRHGGGEKVGVFDLSLGRSVYRGEPQNRSRSPKVLTPAAESMKRRLLLESENAPRLSGAFSSGSQANVWIIQSDFGHRYYPVAARYPALAALVMA